MSVLWNQVSSRIEYFMTTSIYICSAGHSGSTLLDLLIGSHSRAASLGEISQLPKNLALNTVCTCGQPVRSCEMWQEAIGILEEKLDIDVAANPYALNLGYPKASVVIDRSHQTSLYMMKREVVLGLRYMELNFGIKVPRVLMRSLLESQENNFALYDAVRKTQNVDFVVDSSKNYLKGTGLYLSRPDEVRIVLLTRDGRGIFQSSVKRGLPGMAGVNAWSKYYARALPLLKKHVRPQHMLHIKYEALSENPRKELKKICDFVGLDYEEGMLDYTAKVHHITNGNDMRYRRDSTIRPDVAWKDLMSKDDLRHFDNVAGELNRELGYD